MRNKLNLEVLASIIEKELEEIGIECLYTPNKILFLYFDGSDYSVRVFDTKKSIAEIFRDKLIRDQLSKYVTKDCLDTYSKSVSDRYEVLKKNSDISSKNIYRIDFLDHYRPF